MNKKTILSLSLLISIPVLHAESMPEQIETQDKLVAEKKEAAVVALKKFSKGEAENFISEKFITSVVNQLFGEYLSSPITPEDVRGMDKEFMNFLFSKVERFTTQQELDQFMKDPEAVAREIEEFRANKQVKAQAEKNAKEELERAAEKEKANVEDKSNELDESENK